MENIQQDTHNLLNTMIQRVRALGIPREYPYEAQLQELIKQLSQPSDVAVMGETNAGKSTFVNAYLKQKLALEGDEETTAILSYFRNKNPGELEAIKCLWRDGKITFITQHDVNALQGNDEAKLEQARLIDHIEYTLDNPILQRASFIDTPGTRSVVEVHSENASRAYQHDQSLSEEHDKLTRKIGSKATALIYLLKVPKEGDKVFLEEFQRATGGLARAFNTIGVLAKVDEYPERLSQKNELAEKYARQLADQLNTIVPVSAALETELQGLLANEGAELQHFTMVIRQIPEKQLEKMLKSEELFLPEKAASCPVSFEERKRLRGEMPWGVFKTIAEACADPRKNQEEIEEKLKDIAGFDRLREVLERHFFERNDLLRAHNVLQTVRVEVLHHMKNEYLPALLRERRQETVFKKFVARNAGSDPDVAQELQAFLDKNLLKGDAQQASQLVEIFERDLDMAILHLQQYSEDFEMLQQLGCTSQEILSAEEVAELRSLFGQYEQDLRKRLASRQNTQEYAANRQIFWRLAERRANHEHRRQIARHAATRYAHLLDHLEKS